MKLVSWNVNGLRACINKGLINWINQTSYDFYCLQEIKCSIEKIPQEFKNIDQYTHHYFPAKKAGYSGVLILAKKNPKKVNLGIDIEKFDQEGRYICLEYEDFVLINCYVPNGQRDHNRVPYKLEFSNEIYNKCKAYLKKKKKVILCGDINTSHQEIDLANPMANKKTTGFLPIEREFLDIFLKKDMIDSFRFLYPNKQEYTWWTYRNNCRERNIGWRLDYFFVSHNAKENLKSVKHLKEIEGSDHCPVLLELNPF